MVLNEVNLAPTYTYILMGTLLGDIWVIFSHPILPTNPS